MGLNTARAAELLMAMPAEARTIAGHIHDATGVRFGDNLTCSIATPVGETDLKTMLRRLYVATGGNRGHGGYDPSANELRWLYAGDITAANLMASHSGKPAEPKVEPVISSADVEAEREAAAQAMVDALGQPKPAPEPKAAKAAAKPDASQLAALLAQMMASPQIDEDAVRAIVDSATDAKLANVQRDVAAILADIEPTLKGMIDAATRRIEISVNDAPAVTIDMAHKALPDLLKACAAGVHPFLVGPAGSGKTTLAQQIAQALGRSFYMSARVSSEYKLTGFVDATGKAVNTDFRRAYTEGGVFLFDEADASDADAFVALNAALANQWADFPDGKAERHSDFVAIAAGNTYGRGANRDYVGRQQLDAATLDRFAIFTVDYDEELERAVAGNDDWTAYVQKVRKAVESEKVRAIVSPRASIHGAKLLAAGLTREQVAEATIWKGMAEAERRRVEAAVSYATGA